MKHFILIASLAVLGMAVGCAKLGGSAVDLQGNECRVCHASMPPANHMHATHVTLQQYQCSVCHSGISLDPLSPPANGHDNGVLQLAFQIPFDSSNHPTFNPADTSCSSVYCHGAFTTGDSATVKASDAIGTQCDKCHNLSQMYITEPHNAISPSLRADCSPCHPGYSVANSTVNTSTHIDGTLGTSVSTCSNCHTSMPPTDRMHATHVTSRSYQCSVCHSGISVDPLAPPATGHRNGIVNLAFDIPFDTSNHPTFNPADTSCSSVYCHSNLIVDQSTTVKASDSIGSRCDKCHSLTLLYTVDHHDSLITPTQLANCSRCHTGYSVTNSTVNDTTHINGTIETNASACNDCHALRTWTR